MLQSYYSYLVPCKLTIIQISVRSNRGDIWICNILSKVDRTKKNIVTDITWVPKQCSCSSETISEIELTISNDCSSLYITVSLERICLIHGSSGRLKGGCCSLLESWQTSMSACQAVIYLPSIHISSNSFKTSMLTWSHYSKNLAVMNPFRFLIL